MEPKSLTEPPGWIERVGIYRKCICTPSAISNQPTDAPIDFILKGIYSLQPVQQSICIRRQSALPVRPRLARGSGSDQVGQAIKSLTGHSAVHDNAAHSRVVEGLPFAVGTNTGWGEEHL